LWIGIDLPDDVLHQRIYTRIIERLDGGMIDEIRSLVRGGMSFERLHELGFEYRSVSQYVQKLLSYEEMIESFYTESKKYVKRQRTWFRKNHNINWYHPLLDQEQIIARIKKWIS